MVCTHPDRFTDRYAHWDTYMHACTRPPKSTPVLLQEHMYCMLSEAYGHPEAGPPTAPPTHTHTHTVYIGHTHWLKRRCTHGAQYGEDR